MDIIFLDIDGVLRTTASDIWWSDKLIQPIPDSIFKRRFSPTSVSLINQLVNITKAKIVITSTWKTFYKFEDHKKELFSRGLVSDIIDITPVLQNRGTEIQCWLDINSVNKYAVIDDNINDIIDDFIVYMFRKIFSQSCDSTISRANVPIANACV